MVGEVWWEGKRAREVSARCWPLPPSCGLQAPRPMIKTQTFVSPHPPVTKSLLWLPITPSTQVLEALEQGSPEGHR